MSDPFRPITKTQLVREAQIGLSVVAILLSLFLYVAFYKLTGRGQHLPEHVRNAPVAETIWPGAMPPREVEMTPREFLELRRSNPNGYHLDRSPSAERGILDSREPAKGPDVELALNQKSSKSRLPVQSSIVPPRRPKIKVRPITSAPKYVSDKNRNSFDFGEHLKKLLGGFESKPDAVSKVPDLNRKSPSSKVALAADSATQSSASSTVEETVDTESWVPPFTPSEGQGDFKPRVQLTSAETVNANSFPTAEIGSANSATETESNDFNPGFNPDANVQMVEQRNGPSSDTITEKTPSVTKLDTANVTAADAQLLDLADDSWPESKPAVKLVAPHPFTPGSAQPTERLSPRSVANSIPESDITASNDSPARTYSGSSLTWDAAPRTDVPPRQSLIYIVREGDDFWSIAQSIYGDGRYFRALYKYNEPTVPDFDSLSAGTRIGTPLKEDLAKIWPDLCPNEDSDQMVAEHNSSDAADRIYVTRSGDTLFEIARQKLGQASRYLEIKQMNDIRLDAQVNHLSPLRQGVRLVLPVQ